MKRSIRLFNILAGISAFSLQTAFAENLANCPMDKNFAVKQNILSTDVKPIDFSAQNVTYDYKAGLIIIEGDILLKHDGKILKADRVVYHMKSNEVVAVGNITIHDPNGNILHLEKTILKDGLKEGLIENVRILFAGGARLVAKDGMRVGTKTILNSARYSACKTTAGTDSSPTWQIKASKITHNEETKNISYKNVVLEIFGIPVFYTPYFSHPDPSVHSQTGFLSPVLGRSTELGVWLSTPYYFNLSPHKDLTLEPIFTTSEGAVLGGTYRQHTGNGQFNISGSVARVNIRDDNSALTGEHGIRGHIGSMGRFDLPKINVFSADWQWDYNLKWVSSDTYLRRYYADKSDVLQSHAKIEGFWDRSYATAGIYGFQGLKAEDDFGQTAQALPSFDISTVGDAGFLNSKITFNANGAYIYRPDGLRTGRVSLQSGWELPFSSPLGDFYKITATVRTDFYHNRSSGVIQKPQFSGKNGTYLKFRPRIALDWRMPFINTSSSDSQHVLEPMVSIIISPNQLNPDFIPNEDSRNFEFDENNLFSHNRFNGYDRWESGIRINYGLRYNYFAPDITLRATLGQSIRLSSIKGAIAGTTNDFPIGSGYEGRTSDFVGRFDLNIGDNLDFIYRFRLDTKSFALKRNEMIVSGKIGFVKASVRYLNLDLRGAQIDLSGTQLENRREIGAGLELNLDDNFTLHGNLVHDLLNDDTITYNAGIIYKTDCLEFGIRYERRFTTDRDITPSNALLFSLTLKNLG